MTGPSGPFADGPRPGPGGPGGPGPYGDQGHHPPQGPGQPQWQQGPGQPQWQQGPGQFGAAGPAPRKNTRKIVVIVAAVAVVLAGVGVGIAAAFGAFSSSDNGPEAAFNSYVKAANAGDGSKIFDLTCKEGQDAITELMDAYDLTLDEFFGFDERTATIDVEITDVSVDGDTATITFDGTQEYDGEQVTMDGESEELVKEDGSWRVC